MKKLIFAITAAFIFGGAAKAQTTWEIDKSHSNVLFTVSHLVISKVTGKFDDFSGKLVVHKDDFSDAQAEMTIKVATINTDNEKRDTHLKSDDFFLAEKFPEITFKSKAFKKIDDKRYKITGDLTIRGTTKTIDLDAVYGGAIKDPWGNTKSGWELTGKINRFDYGLKWNVAVEAGGLAVGEEVTLTINAELLKIEPAKKK